MFDNIFDTIKKIFNNDELINKIEKLDDWDEIYQEFANINPKCEKFEFYRFLVFLFEFLTGERIRIPISNDGLDSDINIEEVSGGANWKTRAAAATIALSTAFAGGIGGFSKNSATAVDLTQTATRLTPKRSKNYVAPKKQDSEEKVGFFGKVKHKLKSFGQAVWDNKGKILLGGALTLGAVALGKYGMEQYKLKTHEDELCNALYTTDSGDDATYDGSLTINGTTKHKPTRQDINNELKRLERKKNNYSVFDNTPLRRLGVLTTTLGAMWTGVMGFLDVIGKIGDNFKKAGDGVEKVQRGLEEAKRKAIMAAEAINVEEYDKDYSYQTMLEELQRVKGQEYAKRQVKSFFHRVLSDRERSEYTGRKNTAKVVVFNGPSGCGKSMTASILAGALTNGKVYTMSASEVDPKSGQTIAQQLFAKNSWSWDDGDESFSSYIKKHPNDGVVIINEYDKMFKPQGNSPHELDEILRTWMDEGVASLYGREYDCSGITFILTTNESDASLKGLVRADAYGNLYDPSKEGDTTKSLTSVVHDKSFLNRLTVVGFDNLQEEDYVDIAKQNFEDSLEFLSSEFGDYTDVEINEESYKRMGKCLAGINEGARPVEKFIARLLVDIVDTKSELREQGMDVTGLTFKADFDYSEDDFWFTVKLVEEEPEELNNENTDENTDLNSEEQDQDNSIDSKVESSGELKEVNTDNALESEISSGENSEFSDKETEYSEDENSGENTNELFSENLKQDFEVPVAENSDESLLDLERIKDIKEISPYNNMERNTHEIVPETLGRD